MNRKIAKFVKSLNEKTKAVVLEILESPTKWNLIQFYKDNPFSIHTPRGLANIIGRKPSAVSKEVECLARAGVLKKISENGDLSAIYSYDPEKAMVKIIDSLVGLCSESRETIKELIEAIKKS
ncbi:MAG: hypothetical protein A2074_07315 [Candidatus Aquicultor primus]|uniref:ArsR family transcriptional regulator n=1 Tax=Candidatus Aquicultor primus TaxID=1797195 RepID=A0A1F2UQ41_9ACTN|nr:MAG: hypothetical protein A2074_07315 [Candidatus Aquicultor primus]HCG98426.1 hypothetical protein [Actinomycetota bacterium]